VKLVYLRIAYSESRIANPAVGGTMNIITKGITSQQKLSANARVFQTLAIAERREIITFAE
jgi:hypothetical protein